MALAIFDLDNTLLHGDSDQLWGEFFARAAHLDVDERIRISRKFYNDYVNERLDLNAFLEFTLEPLSRFPMEQLLSWRAEYVESVIVPIVLPAAIELVESHRQQGNTLMIITATNHFITEPIAELFGIEHLLATLPEVNEQNQFTGRYTGVPTFREGKVTVLNSWMAQHQASLEGSFFYSDSANDIPLLDQVDHPVAVDPDRELQNYAEKRGWKVISLR